MEIRVQARFISLISMRMPVSRCERTPACQFLSPHRLASTKCHRRFHLGAFHHFPGSVRAWLGPSALLLHRNLKQSILLARRSRACCSGSAR